MHGGESWNTARVARLYYSCPCTNEALGISISADEIDEVAEEWPYAEKCPRCGEDHYLSLDELHADPNGDGGDGSGVREPRVPSGSDDAGRRALDNGWTET